MPAVAGIYRNSEVSIHEMSSVANSGPFRPLASASNDDPRVAGSRDHQPRILIPFIGDQSIEATILSGTETLHCVWAPLRWI